MPDTPPPDRAKILDAVQSILEDDRSLGLTPRDIALLVLMRYEIESSSEMALSLSHSTIQALQSRLDALDPRDSQGAERRLTMTLNRLEEAECLTRADLLRLDVNDDTEYQITPLGDAIADWHLSQSVFSGEPLTAIFRAFITQLACIAEAAEHAEDADDWYFDVVLQMQHALKAMLIAIQRHQKELDRQHAALREFIPTLLNEESEASIGLCEEKLDLVIHTIDDLQEIVITSTSRAFSLLERIAILAAPYHPRGVEQVCDDLARRLTQIAQWTAARTADWVAHHNVVHDFLRANIRIDRHRRVTEALKRAIAATPEWTLEIVRERPFVRMRDDVRETPVRAPPRLPRQLLSKEREYEEVSPDKLPDLLRRYLMEALLDGEAHASCLLKQAHDAIGAEMTLALHFPWLIELMADAGLLDVRKRQWEHVTNRISIEEVRVTK